MSAWHAMIAVLAVSTVAGGRSATAQVLAPAKPRPPQRAQAVSDGQTIVLHGDRQRVQIRITSLGPGFCATHVSIASGPILVYAAPPLTFGPWRDLDPVQVGGPQIILRGLPRRLELQIADGGPVLP